ncbi:hypothetical protein NQ315_007565 [Exocentrus adspersus]|uniref:Uncharacterized protein n=1 Tax=Exocentrus adspersus TaxID=1586481 RepID=A0AAV8W904_9CUCU|nr:hypothetical protein NQ315_007565 [Exocentrus adspersus]
MGNKAISYSILRNKKIAAHMPMLLLLLWLGLSFSEGYERVSQARAPACDYNNNERTYNCKYIRDTFPKVFYGNYHLKCQHCDIRLFSPHTFQHENSLISVNVSDSGIQYVSERAFSIFGNVQYIYLQNNRITNVSRNAFSGLRQVYQLHLENNRISDLTPGFANDLQSNSIILSNNKIVELPHDLFKGVLTLLTLSLDNNNIKKIHKEAFAGLDSLEYLELQNNHLCHLPLGLFKDLRTLRVLNLADNKLTRFSLGTFSGLSQLNGLILANNSIKVFDGADLLPLYHLAKLDLSGNIIYYLDSNGIYVNAPSIRYLHVEDNIFSCQLLTNVLQYFKGKGVDIVTNRGRYDVQNINGIACIGSAVVESVPFEFFMKKVREETKAEVDTCTGPR